MSINREILRNRLQWNKFAVLFSSLISHELSISPHKPGDFKVVISVESKLSNLRGLSRYQEELIRLIEEIQGEVMDVPRNLGLPDIPWIQIQQRQRPLSPTR